MRPMRRAKIKLAEKLGHRPKDGAKDGAEIAAVAVADFMLSMVEAHHTRKNGNVIKMESGLKAQKELEKIEGQITRLQAVEGQNAETLRQIQQLHERVNDLRREISSHLNAWERTELARHPGRGQHVDGACVERTGGTAEPGLEIGGGDCLRDGLLSRRAGGHRGPAESARC